MIRPHQWKPLARSPLMAVRDKKGMGAAPVPAELDFYRHWLAKAVKGKKNPKVAVLGATPELRDLGLRLGAGVVAVDFNLEMLLGMTEVCTIKDRSKEILIKANWLSAPLRHGYFDAVMGDVAFNNISASDYPRLFKNIRAWLKPAGLLLVREVLLPKKDECQGIAEVVADYKAGKISLPGVYLRMRFSVFSPKAYNASTRTLSGSGIFRELDRAYALKLVPKSVYEKLAFRRNSVSHTVFSEKGYLRVLKRHLDLVQTKPALKERGGYYPMFMVYAKKQTYEKS